MASQKNNRCGEWVPPSCASRADEKDLSRLAEGYSDVLAEGDAQDLQSFKRRSVRGWVMPG
ncbi:hypothetical protein ColLi_05380 [Colletotrichum liriopes]|uniref:Uncharacterized protein n=1 Tax=Colletotrichum liriopes TaxID=708192 RepID=A0AA37LSA1_9PEZI|nr:hypothetical protein ColLi_05380 [Colletotrichum liriopes]